MIELIYLNKQKLFDFINSQQYKELPVLPISYHRAISHINNPRAQDNDVLLILAYEQNNLLGYLGILPDNIYTSSGEVFHLGWLSCIWVSPLARGKGIAKKMVLAAYQAYDKHIIITNFTKEAGMLYRKLGIFDNLPDLYGIRYYKTMCLSKVLPKRFPKTANITYLLKIIDFSFNIIWKIFLKKSNFDFNEKAEIPNNEIIKNSYIHSFKIGFKRQEQDFSWIANFPWIIQVEEPSENSKKYHFSYEEKKFISKIIKIDNNSSNSGYLLYVLRNGHLRVPYVITNTTQAIEAAKKIEEIANSKNVDYITLFLPTEITKNIKIKTIFRKKIKRQFLITLTLKEKIKNADDLIIFDGDGDAVFT